MRQHRWGRRLLGAGLFLALAGLAAFILTSPKWYVASAKVWPKMFFGEETNSIYFPFFAQREFELIRGEAVLGKVLFQLGSNVPAGRKVAYLKELRPEAARAVLEDSMNLLPIRGTSLIDILVSDSDPEVAAQIANAIAMAYCGLPEERRTQLTPAEIAGLEADTRQFQHDTAWVVRTKAILAAARENKPFLRVQVDFVGPASPPTSEVTKSVADRIDELLWLDPYKLPGPPAHRHRWLCFGLIGFGVLLCILGFFSQGRRTD